MESRSCALATTFEFEKKRNVPEKYNREIVEKTIKAMKRVDEIKQRRGQAFYAKRMQAKKKSETAEAVKELENIEVLNLPSSTKQKTLSPHINVPQSSKKKEDTMIE